MKIENPRLSVVGMFAVAAIGIAAVASPAEPGTAGNLVITETPDLCAFEDPSIPPSNQKIWGTGNWIAFNLPAIGFHGLRDSVYSTSGDGWIFHYGGGSFFFDCAFQLPSGALLNGVTPFYYDDSVSQEFAMWIWKYNIPGNSVGTTTELYSASSGVSETPGYEAGYRAFAAAEEIVNWDIEGNAAQYFHTRVELSHNPIDDEVRFAGLTLWYQLQISPAPAIQTFPDVSPGFWAFQEIEALAASGITQGYPDGTFRPTTPVTRAQMATFLARALGLHWPDQ